LQGSGSGDILIPLSAYEAYEKKGSAMSFFANVKEVESKVLAAMDGGAVTPYYSLDLPRVYEVLNGAIASEIVCILRYKQHYFGTTGIHEDALQAVFKEHWEDEEGHLLMISERLRQLGGVPNFNPVGVIDRAVSRFDYGPTLADLLREDLLAERVVIKIYGDIVDFFGKDDPVTRRMFESILKDEEDHADDLSDLLYTIDPTTGKAMEVFTGDSSFVAFTPNGK
jgi:bacterioferritin